MTATTPLTKELLADLLNGRQYRNEITKDEAAMAKAAGLVAIYGYSDDGVILSGAIDEHINAWDGTEFRISRSGVLLKSFENLEKDDEDELEAYFKAKAAGFVEFEALWSPQGMELSWLIQPKQSFPIAPFTIKEEGEPDFCRGVVIDLADLKGAA